ncbi:endo-beta- -glucanase [Ophiostoma piceae UAMH 11346]|uniref:glucan endo-1,3-beta-D-glucosidase n=1 Tax=Ophiostoma piceae (strain UAMH 11346) TaxID=1262450 RepID=S3CKG8_OPHP1|nr:endo-beta- -glucanase [Ophiostoma piceae UAMH 11346]
MPRNGRQHDRQYGQAAAASVGIQEGDVELVSPISPPPPPPPPPHANITPGADNFSESAAGGMAGIAYSVADRNPRESGVEAMRSIQPQTQQNEDFQTAPAPTPAPGYPQQAYPPQQYRGQYAGYDQPEHMLRPSGPGSSRTVDRDSRSSLQGLGNAAYPPGMGTPGTRTPSRSPHSLPADVYADDPYQGYSAQDPHLGLVNPNEIEDDGDDGLEYTRGRPVRNSMLSLPGHSTKSSRSGTASGIVGPAAVGAATVGVAAAAGGATATLAHNVASGHGSRMASSGGARYNALSNGRTEYQGAGGAIGGGGGGRDGYSYGGGSATEKSEWLAKQSHSKRIWKWVTIIVVAAAVIGGIVCGVLFGVVFKNNSKSSSNSSSTASGDTSANGDLSLNSPEIQKLLNNKNLHKVFPGIDYTPINTQYPACLSNPPSQNNITRDVAILSQLSNTIRLYGTDCNQTEMTMHAINQLEMNDTIKIWLGVWQDNNATTNERQLSQMWDILDKYGGDPFKGLIVANEILFREQMTVSELSTLLASVRTNLTKLNIDLPVATSDLGTSWTSELAQASDYIMANIHPFFGGVNANDASAWTWSFWDVNNGAYFKTDTSKNIISETGWPSQGGTDCGSGSTETVCPDAAVAGISQMNQFLDTWVCDALTNGTQYFWFEAFDEPWKIAYNSGDENWEDHWGIMDVNRDLKPGVTIPDCGGKTV